MCSRRGSQAREGAAEWLQEPLPSLLAPAEPGPLSGPAAAGWAQRADRARLLPGLPQATSCPHLGVPGALHGLDTASPACPPSKNATMKGGLSSSLTYQISYSRTHKQWRVEDKEKEKLRQAGKGGDRLW